MSQFLAMYNQMGAEQFAKGVSQVAPYFATIDPEFVDLRPGYAEVILRNQTKVHNHLGTVHAIAMCNGYAEVILRNQTKVHNHLGTVHAIAMCNAAELVAGLTTDVSIPTGARWIPQGMEVKYLAKAKTDLRVKIEDQAVDYSQPGEVVVPVAAYDSDDTKCFTAAITMNIKH